MPEDRSILTRPAAAPDRVVAYGAQAEQVADVRDGGDRARHRPLLLVIHGGFWRPAFDRAHTGPMTAALAKAGWTVAAIEYRRVPGKPDLTSGDVALALQALPGAVSRHDGRVLAIGHSAGGHLALWAASARPSPQLEGALALAPAADLRLSRDLDLGDGAARAFLGEDPERRADLDPARLPSPEIEVAIVHGDADEIVPVSVSESYLTAHPRARLRRLPGVGHFALIDPETEAFGVVLGELERLA